MAIRVRGRNISGRWRPCTTSTENPSPRSTRRRRTMRIYYHPASTTSRPLMLFAAESGMDIEFKLVDIMGGEHCQPQFTGINPTRLVPVLEDGDFRLTESSAILKYLAEKSGSSAYPKELRQRARVNEVMDWVNTQFCRDVAYGPGYPQILPT